MKKIIALFSLISIFSVCIFSINVSSKSANIKIGIIDSGISTKIIDGKNISEGYNYVNNNSDTEDLIGHGTFVSELIVGDKNKNIIGINNDVKLVPLVCVGGNAENPEIKTENISKAIYDAVDKYNCDIINISICCNTYSEILEEAINYASDKKVLIVASSGNTEQFKQGSKLYPAAFNNVISVSSCQDNNNISPFSIVNDRVDLLFYGNDILLYDLDYNLVISHGTSFSAAKVSGYLSLLKRKIPEIDNKNINSNLYQLIIVNKAGYKIFNPLSLNNYCPYIDISPNEYYYKSTIWSYLNNISNGVQYNYFMPNNICKRCDAIVLLWRFANNPVDDNNNISFIDVNPNDYFYKAVKWAYNNGITNGKSNRIFSPYDYCTRAEIITFIYRMMNKDINKINTANSFIDVNENDYYYNSVEWGKNYGIIFGKEYNKFCPYDYCKRSEIVTMIYRAQN